MTIDSYEVFFYSANFAYLKVKITLVVLVSYLAVIKMVLSC